MRTETLAPRAPEAEKEVVRGLGKGKKGSG